MKEDKGSKGKKAKRSNTKPIVTNSLENTNVINYPRGFKKWLKRNGFLIKEFGLYYDKNCGSKKKCNYAKSYATSISELLRDFHMQKNEEKKK